MNKQSIWPWFETGRHSCDVTVMLTSNDQISNHLHNITLIYIPHYRTCCSKYIPFSYYHHLLHLLKTSTDLFHLIFLALLSKHKSKKKLFLKVSHEFDYHITSNSYISTSLVICEGHCLQPQLGALIMKYSKPGWQPSTWEGNTTDHPWQEHTVLWPWKDKPIITNEPMDYRPPHFSQIWIHDDVNKWKHFRVTGHLCGEFTTPRWIPCTKASDAELSCFIWSAYELTVE